MSGHLHGHVQEHHHHHHLVDHHLRTEVDRTVEAAQAAEAFHFSLTHMTLKEAIESGDDTLLEAAAARKLQSVYRVSVAKRVAAYKREMAIKAADEELATAVLSLEQMSLDATGSHVHDITSHLDVGVNRLRILLRSRRRRLLMRTAAAAGPGAKAEAKQRAREQHKNRLADDAPEVGYATKGVLHSSGHRTEVVVPVESPGVEGEAGTSAGSQVREGGKGEGEGEGGAGNTAVRGVDVAPGFVLNESEFERAERMKKGQLKVIGKSWLTRRPNNSLRNPLPPPPAIESEEEGLISLRRVVSEGVDTALVFSADAALGAGMEIREELGPSLQACSVVLLHSPETAACITQFFFQVSR